MQVANGYKQQRIADAMRGAKKYFIFYKTNQGRT